MSPKQGKAKQATLTVLAEYQRLEAEGIWRASPDDQRRDVIVAMGEATITLNAPNGQALAHWSLPAMERLNQGETPAVYGPGADATDVLEITDADMIAAIDRVLSAIEGTPAKRRSLMRLVPWVVALSAIAAGIFWLPGAVASYTARLVPLDIQQQIGGQILLKTGRVAGLPCTSASGDAGLAQLSERLFPETPMRLVVFPSTLERPAILPNATIVLSHVLIEDYETPEVAAGFFIAEALHSNARVSFAELLETAGLRASLVLLTSGRLRDGDLQAMAEWLMVRPAEPVNQDQFLKAMRARSIATEPYARALDISGETTARLITASTETSPALLSDEAWAAVQSICAE